MDRGTAPDAAWSGCIFILLVICVGPGPLSRWPAAVISMADVPKVGGHRLPRSQDTHTATQGSAQP